MIERVEYDKIPVCGFLRIRKWCLTSWTASGLSTGFGKQTTWTLSNATPSDLSTGASQDTNRRLTQMIGIFGGIHMLGSEIGLSEKGT